MNNDDLIRFREEYKKLYELKKQELKKYKRLQELEAMDLIKEYLELIEWNSSRTNLLFCSKKDIVDTVISRNKYEATSNIYIYMGTYFKRPTNYSNQEFTDLLVDYENELATYSLYKNIEDVDFHIYSGIEVPIDEREEFIKDKIIISKKQKNHLEYINFFDRLQVDYYYNVLLKNEEFALEKIKKKYHI